MTDLDRSAIVHRYDDLPAARRAVDSLAEEGFPVERLAIVWRGLRLVDDVTGRRDLLRSVLDRAWTGAFLGLVFGLLITLLSTAETDVADWAVVLSWVSAGIVAGAVLGLISYFVLRSRQNYTTAARMDADHFELWCDRDEADRAARALGTTVGGSTRALDPEPVDPDPHGSV